MAVQSIPAGYHSVTPYLIIKGAAEAIEFYKKAFSATLDLQIDGPGGTVGHAEISIGDSRIMLAEECPESEHHSPKTLGETSVSLLIYLANVDARFEQAVQAGAKVLRPVRDQFYGDRSGMLQDPFGHIWNLATHVEDIPPGEMQARAEAWMKKQAK